MLWFRFLFSLNQAYLLPIGIKHNTRNVHEGRIRRRTGLQTSLSIGY